jgi:hypothetical protein
VLSHVAAVLGRLPRAMHRPHLVFEIVDRARAKLADAPGNEFVAHTAMRDVYTRLRRRYSNDTHCSVYIQRIDACYMVTRCATHASNR